LRAFVVEVIHITIPVWDNAENASEVIIGKLDLYLTSGGCYSLIEILVMPWSVLQR